MEEVKMIDGAAAAIGIVMNVINRVNSESVRLSCHLHEYDWIFPASQLTGTALVFCLNKCCASLDRSWPCESEGITVEEKIG